MTLYGLPAAISFSAHLRFSTFGGKRLDEVVLRHAALVDHDLADLALVAAHVVDLRAQDVAQLLDRLDREADAS